MRLPLTPRLRVALGLALLVALVFDFLLYNGFFASDDIGYWTSAESLVKGVDFERAPELRPSLTMTRLGMTLPDSAIYWLVGGDVNLGAWCFLVYHLAIVLVAFALGRLVHGDRAGLIAAYLAATSPVLGVYAGTVLPDNPGALWLGLALVSLELARRRMIAEGSTWRSVWPACFATGALIGMAYMVKETGVIMVVPAAVVVMAAAPRLRDPVWIRNGAFMAAGLAAVMLVELFLLRAVTGEWLFRLGMVEGSGEAMEFRMDDQGGANPLARLWYALDVRLLPVGPITTVLLLVAGVAYPFLRERSLALILFFWWPFLFVTVGSTSFTAYLPSSIQTRYYSLAIVPGVVMLAAVAMAALARWRSWQRPPAWARGRGAGLFLAAALALIALFELSGNLPRAGTLYACERARGFEVTYQRARQAYPQYPIVLSGYYSRRMRPLWLRDRNEVYAGRFGTIETPPEPPYLYLESRRELRESAGKQTHKHEPGLEIETLEVVSPPDNRRVVLADAVRRLFGLPPARSQETDLMGSGVIQLVTRTGAAHRLAPAARLPVLSSAPEFKVREVEPGYVVEWVGPPPPDFSLSIPERGSYKVTPSHPTSRLPAPASRLRIAIDVRVVKGGPTRVQLTAYGYRAAGGAPVQGTATTRLKPRAAPETLEVELASPDPMTAFRLRVSVRSGSNWPGAVHLGDPRVEPL